MVILFTLLVVASSAVGAVQAQGGEGEPTAAKVPRSAIAEHLEWVGVAVQEPDYTIWGASPILGDDGKVHLFVARWPEPNVDPAWRKSSEIAHYVGDRPEGPFRCEGVALRGTGEETWDRHSAHNPEVRRFGETYALFYVSNDDYHQPPHPLNQCIGLAVSRSLDGPWTRVGKDGLVLGPSADPGHWTYGKQVVNPAVLELDGTLHLYFKSRFGGGTAYGLATARSLEGPWVMQDEPLTGEGITLEDASAFVWEGRVCLLTTDNFGHVTGIRGGGTLWVSDGGRHFPLDRVQVGYDRLPAYYRAYDPEVAKRIYGGEPKLERPKILVVDGAPAWLYGPSGWTIHGGDRTACYVLRIDLPDGASPLPTDEDGESRR